MARPQKQTVDYFPHYSNASSGKTLYILESKFGNDGYAFWFKLLELLANSEGHVYDVRNPAAWEFLLARTRVADDKANAIMKLLVDLDAIDAELWAERTVWIQNLVDNIADAYRNRKTDIPIRPSLNGRKVSATGLPDVNNGVSDVRNPHTKLNYTKGENKYTSIFEYWNEQRIKQHRGLAIAMKKAIDSACKDYSEDDIKTAISNYAVIVNGSEYYFDHRWGLAEFLSRRNHDNIERFLDLEIAKQNFRKGDEQIDTQRKGKYEQRTRTDPRRPIADPEALARSYED